ncbi:hypothetical protein AB0K92_30955 [Streptomyces sp. NPDC052687]|uniref:hypothetical protein n=1 Tax=Streptomyces sp. NPDC052687 TaxID=3154759 RepID=UPI00344547FE
MSHASVSTDTGPARITEAVPARPLLVVEHLGHRAGSAVRFTFCAEAAADAPAFTLCAGPIPANVALTYTYGAPTAAPVAVESDSVAGSWI